MPRKIAVVRETITCEFEFEAEDGLNEAELRVAAEVYLCSMLREEYEQLVNEQFEDRQVLSVEDAPAAVIGQ